MRNIGSKLFVLLVVAAIVVGLALCLIRMYVRPLRWIASTWIEFCRATPIYVQLMWVNYVWPELIGWPTSFTNWRPPPRVAGSSPSEKKFRTR